MAGGEIKARIALEGEKEFVSAMSAAAREIKALAAEERLIEAQFQATGDAQQYAADKANNLRAQIASQQGAVDAAKKAIEQLTKQGVQPNDAAMQKWRTKLSNAQTGLVTLESKLQKSEASMVSLASDGAKPAADAVGNIKTKANDAKSGLSSLDGKVKTSETNLDGLATGGADPAADALGDIKTEAGNAKTGLNGLDSKAKTTEGKLGNLAANGADVAAEGLGDINTEAGNAKTGLNGLDSKAKTTEGKLGKLATGGANPAADGLAGVQEGASGAASNLGSLDGAVGKAESSMETAGGTAEGYGEQLQAIGKKIDVQAAIQSIDKITGAIEGTVKAAARATKAVIDIAVDAGEWASELKQAALEMTLDPETYQSWQYASDQMDTAIEDIAHGIQEVEKGLEHVGKKATAGNNEWSLAVAQMGINVRDAGGKLKTSKELFWECIDYLHGIGDEGERAAKATQIFGNDWKKMNPLIEQGSAAFKALAQEGVDIGAVVSGENVEALGDMSDAFGALGMQLNALKMNTLAALAPTFERIAQAMGTAVTALNEFISSEEGQEALTELGNALEGIIQSFIGVDENGENGFNKLIETAKSGLDTFKQGLLWIQENSGTVAEAIKGIGAAYAALKVSGAVLTFMALLKSTPLGNLKALFNLGGGGSVPTTPTVPPSAPVSAAGGSTVGATLSSAAAKILPPAAVVAATVWGAHAIDRGATERYYGDFDATMEAIRQKTEGASEPVQQLAETFEHLGAAYSGEEGIADVFKSIDPELMRTLLPEDSTLMQMYDTLGNWSAAIDNMPPGLQTAEQAWRSLAAILNADDLEEQVEALSTVTEGLEITDQTTEAGENAGQGFANGIASMEADVVAAADALGDAAVAALESALDIQSPSKVMARLGGFTAQGFAEGIEASSRDVVRAVDGMAGIAAGMPVGFGGYGRAGTPGMGLGGNSYSSSFYVDKYYQNTSEDARALALRVQDAQGWTQQGFGHRG